MGDTITLTGNGGETMAVTVDQVMDPLQVGPDDQADPGQRYVGVQITLKNAKCEAWRASAPRCYACATTSPTSTRSNVTNSPGA